MASPLSPEERGFVAGLALLGAEKPVLGRALAGETVGRAWADLKDLTHEQRVTALGDLLRDTLLPLPPGIEALDRSWVQEALAGEPTGLALALAEGVPALAELAVGLARARGEVDAAAWPLDTHARLELRRLVFAPLETLTVEPAGPLGRELSALPGPALEQELARWGARTVGASLAGAPLDLRARAMATAGAPWSVEIASAAARPTDPAARESARQLVAAAAATPAVTPLHRLRAVGLRALARALFAEGTASALRVAGRLPVELGRALLAAC